MLAEYEMLNHDLAEPVRRQLALFVIAPTVGKPALEELFERPFGQTLVRHRAWMWYTAMLHSGLEREWEIMQAAHNFGMSMRGILVNIRDHVTREKWLLFSRRLGKTNLNPHCYSRTGTTQRIWTKGGSWSKQNNITKIVVLGEHLKGRDFNYHTFTRHLDPSKCTLMETELHQSIDYRNSLVPTATRNAIEYIRRRIPQLADLALPTVSYATASWFFQREIPHPKGGEVNWSRKLRPGHHNDRQLDWLPE